MRTDKPTIIETSSNQFGPSSNQFGPSSDSVRTQFDESLAQFGSSRPTELGGELGARCQAAAGAGRLGGELGKKLGELGPNWVRTGTELGRSGWPHPVLTQFVAALLCTLQR